MRRMRGAEPSTFQRAPCRYSSSGALAPFQPVCCWVGRQPQPVQLHRAGRWFWSQSRSRHPACPAPARRCRPSCGRWAGRSSRAAFRRAWRNRPEWRMSAAGREASEGWSQCFMTDGTDVSLSDSEIVRPDADESFSRPRRRRPAWPVLAPAQKQAVEFLQAELAPGRAAVVALVGAFGRFHLAQQGVHFIDASAAGWRAPRRGRPWCRAARSARAGPRCWRHAGPVRPARCVPVRPRRPAPGWWARRAPPASWAKKA